MAYAGFDTGNFPGLPALQSWYGDCPYSWVGYYLTTACHTDATFTPWSNNRAAIANLGFGITLIYVGLAQGGCGDCFAFSCPLN
jgi:hypothetical protein